MNFESAGILVVGSLNMDFVVKVNRLPKAGQTIAGEDFMSLPGGKGANQAYTVGRLGGRGWMVGCVGQDIYGEQLRASLLSAGVDTSHVRATREAATGVALISVEHTGQNQIIIAAGANKCLKPSEVKAAIDTHDASYLLLQLESPMEAVETAARHGRAKGMTVILDPAPSCQLNSSLLENIDVLTPNESEALSLLALNGDAISLDQAAEIARRLLAMGPRRVILKLGEKGVWLVDERHSQHFAARPMEAVDVTAAGDCFNGALAVGLSEAMPIAEAIAFATTAATITVTRLGAQASIPDRAEVEWMMREGELHDTVVEVRNEH